MKASPSNPLPTPSLHAWFLGLLGVSAISTAQAIPPPSSFGVWDRGGTHSTKDYPFIRGTSYDGLWAEVEKSPGVYDWSALDTVVNKATQENLHIYVSFGVGPNSPHWIYEKGVPKVFTNDVQHAGKFPYYPYYLSPEYKLFFKRFITEVSKHIAEYPKEKQNHIAFIQVKTGCTGDECAYKGKPTDPKYILENDSPTWQNFRLECFSLFKTLFQDNETPKISLLFNNIGGDDGETAGKYPEAWDWVTRNIKGGFGAKVGALSRGYQLQEERTVIDTWHNLLIAPKGVTVFGRSEMDQTWTKSSFQSNVPLAFYWSAINALNLGQSIWDVSQVAIETAKRGHFDYAFNFFDKYAWQIHPETATDAFCALHKGLDYADKQAYPEDKFGRADRHDDARAKKICAQYSAYGAKIDDPAILKKGQVAQRDAQLGFNDVGWQIWPDNYSRFLEQIDAEHTSVGLWRIGGPLTNMSPVYSRFARGFEHSTGKDAMYFKLQDGFCKTATPKTMTIHLVWYDKNPGSTWKLDYDGGPGGMKTALAITGKGDQQWHEETVTLKDAVLHHGGIKGSDLALVNTDDKDDIFSIIEVHRGEAEKTPLLPTNPTAESIAAGAEHSKGPKFAIPGHETETPATDKDSKKEERKKKTK